MAVLYLTEPGARLHKVDGRLVVRKGDEILEEIPLIHVEQVVLMGRGVGVTTAAVYALMRRGVDVVYLSGGGRYVFRIVGSEHRHSRLRYAQALAVGRPAFALPVARAVIAAKVHNQRALLLRHAGEARGVRRPAEDMGNILKRIRQADSLERLRGLEGQAAHLYFSALRRLIPPPADGRDWGFRERAYHPPPDPVNALLSLAYTLLLKEMIAACQLAGLDPALGFFHVLEYGRPSLALDLMEPFRPLVGDAVVLYALTRPLVELDDFKRAPLSGEAAPSEGESAPAPPKKGAQPFGAAIYLKTEPRRRFLTVYEQRMAERVRYPPSGEQTAFRRILRLQAEALARCILEERPEYEAFTVR